MNKVLLIGASGRIGRLLCEKYYDSFDYCRTNKHCLFCHNETTKIIVHPINEKNLGGVEFECLHEDCQAKGFIPRLEKHLMTKAEKKKADKARAEWMKANPDWRGF